MDDRCKDWAAVIAETEIGPEVLRVLSIVARHNPKLFVATMPAVERLIRDGVAQGLLHPRAMAELEQRPN